MEKIGMEPIHVFFKALSILLTRVFIEYSLYKGAAEAAKE